jgi:mono/diheme cytochrome c family protein
MSKLAPSRLALLVFSCMSFVILGTAVAPWSVDGSYASDTPSAPGTLALAATPVPTREPATMFTPQDRLAPPPMSDPPTQVEQGHHVYWLTCMVCHGDRGQGLTDEWRGALDPADRNCWQSRCHAPNHPPGGFEFPKFAPAIIGASRLAHHETAAGLYEFLRTRMPWQAPGLLSDDEYWQLTAFLVDANGVPLDGITLGPDNANGILLARASTQGTTPAGLEGLSVPQVAAGLAVLFLLSAVGVVWYRNHAA